VEGLALDGAGVIAARSVVSPRSAARTLGDATLRAVSASFADLANSIAQNLPRNPERTVALRKLLDAKDCAVRPTCAGRGRESRGVTIG
jgi:hypothetical protein